MAGFLSRAVERSCPGCGAHVPDTSRFCTECRRFVRGGPSNARAAAIITTVVGIPFAIALIVLIEVTVAFFGLLGCAVVLVFAWRLDESHPMLSDTFSTLVLGVEATLTVGLIVY